MLLFLFLPLRNVMSLLHEHHHHDHDREEQHLMLLLVEPQFHPLPMHNATD